MGRPKTIPVVAAFLFVATAIATVVATSLLFPGPLLDWLWKFNPPASAAFHAMGRMAGVLLLALGVGTCAAGAGLLRGRKWAWWFAVLLFAIDATGNVVSWWATGDWLKSVSGVAVSSAFLYCLMRPGVREFFQE